MSWWLGNCVGVILLESVASSKNSSVVTESGDTLRNA